TALLLSSFNLQAAPNGKSSPEDPFALLPDDTKAVVSINFRQILDSALLKKSGLAEKIQKEMKGDKETNKVIGELGIDPLKDVHQVINALAGDKKNLKQLIIVNGKFDVKKFQQKAETLAKEKGEILRIENVPDGRGGSYKI